MAIQEGKFNPNNKTYHEFEDIKINKTAKDSALIENIIPELLSILNRFILNLKNAIFTKHF